MKGTVQWEFTAKTEGTASVTAKADGLPATDLQVLTPKSPAAQRMLLAGGTTSAQGSATVTVGEATGGVTIRKKDPEGTRMVSTAFQLLDKDGQKVAEGKTDAQGDLAFDKLPFGTYRLRGAGAVAGGRSSGSSDQGSRRLRPIRPVEHRQRGTAARIRPVQDQVGCRAQLCLAPALQAPADSLRDVHLHVGLLQLACSIISLRRLQAYSCGSAG
ncbi:MSCRAMM family protein [Streptomyces leeuwenhoekii]